MTDRDYSAFQDGLRKFVRLVPLRADPSKRKYIQDEFDLMLALESVRSNIKQTSEMFGKKKYRDTPFDFHEDVCEEMEEWLFGDKEQDLQREAVLRKKYQAMYYLVIYPVLDIFATLSHGRALLQCDEIINEVIEQIENHPYGGTYDDALVTQAMINNEIRQKEEARQSKLRKRRKRIDRLSDVLPELTFD